MIKDFGGIDNNLINEVCNFFEKTYNFKLLLKKYSFLDYNVLYSILYSTGKYNRYLYHNLCQANINESKILIISDTHYGSIYENINYTYDVFNFAINNGIHTILHGGDVIQSNFNQREGYDVIKQAEYFIDKYPFDKSINNYVVLGNHDYSAINSNKTTIDILRSRRDINILGFKKSYLKWCGNVISIHHAIEDFKLILPICAESISFKGHSHFYHSKERTRWDCEKVYIPSLSDDLLYHTSNPKEDIIKPGFLLAEVDNDNVIIGNYSFTCGQIVRENELKKVLKRK